MKEINKETILELFAEGYNCAQIVIMLSLEEGEEKDILLKTACSFGGGMCSGKVCGALTGGLMVLSSKLAKPLPDGEEKKLVRKLSAKLVSFFGKEVTLKYGSDDCNCKTIIEGCHGNKRERCSEAVLAVLEKVEEFINEAEKQA